MTTTYLTQQACEQRERDFFTRLAKEAHNLEPAGITWEGDSDFWRLPPKQQLEVMAIAFRFCGAIPIPSLSSSYNFSLARK